MTLVQLIYFPGNGSHRSPMLVNTDHVVFLIEADGGKNGEQCWLRLTNHHQDFLVSGSFNKLSGILGG